MSEYVVLTGATGLLGRYMLRDLLLARKRVCVITRGESDEHARSRINEILQPFEEELGNLLPRPVCFAGNILDKQLDLTAQQLDWVAKNCTSLIHNAAIVDFEKRADGEPFQTNIGGTENVLDFCRVTSIRNLHYVSTAYVCGYRDGQNRNHPVMENELDCGQSFRNDYEESKFKAEKLVRSADHLDHLDQLTVYRPSVIAGDSRTGYTASYHGIYHYLKLISIVVRSTEPDQNGVRNTPIRLDMQGDEQRNVVPVDWVSAVICHLFGQPQAHGNTYHLAPDVPLTPREIIEAGYSYFNSAGVEFCGYGGYDAKDSESQMDRDWHSNMTIYKSYEHSDPSFDTSNLKKFAPDLPCPRIDEPMLHRFWTYGENNRWGKAGDPKSKVPFDVGHFLKSRVSQSNGSHPKSSEMDVSDIECEANFVDLDVLGVGGGQWQLKFRGDELVRLEDGLNGNTTIRLSSDEFATAIQRNDLPMQNEIGSDSDSSNGSNGQDVLNMVFRKLSSATTT